MCGNILVAMCTNMHVVHHSHAGRRGYRGGSSNGACGERATSIRARCLGAHAAHRARGTKHCASTKQQQQQLASCAPTSLLCTAPMQGGAVTEVSAHEPPLSVRGVRVRKRRIELGSKRYASFHRRGVMCTNRHVVHCSPGERRGYRGNGPRAASIRARCSGAHAAHRTRV